MSWISPEGLKLALEVLKEHLVFKEVGKGLFSGKYSDLSGKPTIPTKTSQLTNDSQFVTETGINTKGYLTEETDPTVPAWAKAATKPSYTADEVGALPADTAIPKKVSDLSNDSGFQTASQVTATITTRINGLASQTYVNQQIANSAHLKKEKVTVLPLPSSADSNTIYIVAKTDGSGNDIFDEYLLMDGKFELVGNSKMDLSGYLKYNDEATEEEINNIFAGWW